MINISASNKSIDPNKLKLIEYLVLPKACRPMSLKRFAEDVLGVSEPTVHVWKKSTEVSSLVQKTIKQRFSNDIPDILMALRNSALAGNPKAAKIFLDHICG